MFHKSLRFQSLKKSVSFSKTDVQLLLRLVKICHTLRYEQLLRFFNCGEESIYPLLLHLAAQGRIYYAAESGLVCEDAAAANAPDYGMIAAFWVLLDFKKTIIYPVDGEAVKLRFYCQDELYDIFYVPRGQEQLMNQVLENSFSGEASRLVIVESKSQAANIGMDGIYAFVRVRENGTVSYFTKADSLSASS